MNISMNRRDFLKYASLAPALLLASPSMLLSATGREAAAGAKSSFVPDVELLVTATQGNVSVLPGEPTRVFTYRGQVLKGDPASIEPMPGSYLGPVIRVRKGQRVRIDFVNELGEESIIHWHGLHVPEEMDGHPRYAIGPGRHYVYEFTVADRAGTYWFHPHPHGRTGKQIYFGLTGLFLVSDDEEQAAGLPSGEYDLPLILQDRSFDRENQLVFLSDDRMGGGMMGGGTRGGMMGGGMMGGGTMGGGMMGGGGMGGGMMGGGGMGGGGMMDMMTRMMGFLGDRILVNGRPDATLSVATRVYRLRLLNGSNSRIYKLAWEDGAPLTVIGTDGGLLEKPVQRRYVTLAPAQRVDLWVDFSHRPVGTQLTLRSLPFQGDMAMGGMMGGGMMGGMMGNQALPNGAAFPVLKVRVERKEKETLALPERLSRITRYHKSDAVNSDKPRLFNITMGMMEWGINGRSFEMEGVADDEIVKLNTTEVWEFANDASRGMMGMMAHPIHIHGLQFQVVERRGASALAAGWKSVSAGYVDEGWKDTVLLMPGERVRLLLRFKDYAGLFAYHCHMLEHGDTGLMRNYLVRA